jgi:lipoyl(octanoyl) transferase
MISDMHVRRLGRRDYQATWQAMQAFTDARDPATPDELWIVEHDPVFTLGRAARREHVLDPGDIPVVPVDRGGQVTYHGPGQLVVYTLVDLRRLDMGVRRLVATLEEGVVALLAEHDLEAGTRPGAPGVYVAGRKIAALGLRVRRGCSFHGLALNVDCDLEPFTRIDPCGYRGLAVTRTRDEGVSASADALAERLVAILTARLGHDSVTVSSAATLESA